MSQTSIFPQRTIPFTSGPEESVILGGRDQFPLLKDALAGVKQVCFYGWGSQAPAQARNFKDSLTKIGSDIKVVVGLREGSKNRASATAAGFTEDDGTLGESYKMISESDLVIVLIADGAQTEEYQKIFAAMKPGATLGFSHGFLQGYLESIGVAFRKDVNVIMVAPKGMGPSLRRLYEQGLTTNGSGINSSIAVFQDITTDGSARRIAEGWAIAIGAPVIFTTSMGKEWRSDLFGERSMLLGALWGMVEGLFEKFAVYMSGEKAFENSVLALTSFISPQISKLGLKGFYETFVVSEGQIGAFQSAYTSTYNTFLEVMREIYKEVSSGRELQDVIRNTKIKMESIEDQPMWKIGEQVRASGLRVNSLTEEGAYTAGVYIAGVMAQFQVLLENGHCLSEIINESLIEGTDSLTPFMDAKGVAFMVDNCSTTARLGTRKWGPVFKKAILGISKDFEGDPKAWLGHSIHADIAECYKLKPAVPIVVAVAA